MTQYQVDIYSIGKYDTDYIKVESCAKLLLPNSEEEKQVLNEDNTKEVLRQYDDNSLLLYTMAGIGYSQIEKKGYYIVTNYQYMLESQDCDYLYHGQTIEFEQDWLDKYKFVCQNYVCNSRQYLMVFNFTKI